MKFMKIEDLMPGDKFMIISGCWQLCMNNKILTIKKNINRYSIYRIYVKENIGHNFIWFYENEAEDIKLIELTEE